MNASVQQPTQSAIPSDAPAASGRFGSEGRHYPELDGIRGIAILVVMLHHFFGAIPPEVVQQGGQSLGLVTATAAIGWVGVDLFFVLSGFLITGILLDTRERPHYLRNFYARRVLRIFPLYYGALVLVFVLGPLFVSHDASMQRLSEYQSWYWLYGENFLFPWVDASAGGGWELVHLWSLAVEEHFYLLWPVLVLLVVRKRLMALCILLAVLAETVRVALVMKHQYAAAYMITPARMDALALGALLALAVRGPGGLGAVVPAARWAALLCGLGLVALGMQQHGFHFEWKAIEVIGYPLLAVFFAAMIALAIRPAARNRIGALTRIAPLRFLGKYSYGVYVYHYLLLAFYIELVPPGELAHRLGSVWLGVLGFVALGITWSVLLAVASWHLFEKFFIGLKRHFEYGR